MKKFFLTLAVVLCAATAWAAEKTVTYTFLAEQTQHTDRWKFTFTRSGTSFGYKNGAKTATVYDNQYTTGFTVELDDGLQLTYSRDAGRMMFVGFHSFWLNLQGDENTHLILSSSHYYVTHVRLATADGDPLIGQASPWTDAGAQMDADVDMVTQTDALDNYRTFDAHITTRQTFARLTVTYADAPRPYAISFNEVEGLTNPNPATYSVTTNTFNIVAPTRTGYDLGAVTYTDALHPNPTAAVLPMNIARGNAATRKDISFNAAWTAHHYSVHYEANGGSGEMDDQDFTYGDAGQALSANSFTREGYTFVGWNTAADGSGTGYTDGQQTPNVTATDGATVTLYAQWAAGVRVTYIDVDGTEQNVVAIPIVGSQTDYGTPGTGELWWYVLDGEVSLDHLHFNDDFTHLILADGARLTANSSTEIAVRAKGFTIYAQSNGTGQIIASSERLDGIGVDANYKFTINGGNISAATSRENQEGISAGDITINGGSVEAIGGKNGYGIYASNFTINGGNVTATGIGEYGLGISGRLTINGGNLTATATGENGHGIYATGTGITLAGGNVTATGGDSGHGIFGATTLAGGTVRASSYSGAVRTPSNNDYYTDGTSIYYLTLNDEQKKNIAGKTMQPALRLRDNGNNNTAISGHGGETSAVFIAGRTLYKDGDWNTLTLPFDLGDEEAQGGHEFDGTPLEGATVMELDTEREYEGHQTGYDADGTLYLYFKDATGIAAGRPYLVKWETTGEDIENPVFLGVTIDNDNTPVTSSDGNVAFCGNYSPVALPGNDASNLYLGTQNKLYWPSDDKSINAFRAYFHVALDGNQPARNIVLNLGEDSPTAVEEIQLSPVNSHLSTDEVWFDLSGRKYTSKPTKPGIYIHKGEKVSL